MRSLQPRMFLLMAYRGLFLLLCGLVLVGVVDAQDKKVAEREEAAIQSYLGLVFQELENHECYPRAADGGGLNGRVVLRFTLRRDGKIVDPEVVEVTGHDSFRVAALQALTRMGQLPRLPDEIQRDELRAEAPINFQIVGGSGAGFAAAETAEVDDALEKYRNYTPEQLRGLPQEEINSEVPIMYTMAANRASALGEGEELVFGMELNGLMYPGL